MKKIILLVCLSLFMVSAFAYAEDKKDSKKDETSENIDKTAKKVVDTFDKTAKESAEKIGKELKELFGTK